ncbi:hypothetical protein APB52_32745 [Pseudomonas aeruginosa]|uniref:hypothetical protein n=1 Tax=Pseudomonas aeruginosa TaxID=287 RepID=UPI0004453480|nr:hypothetical protein [Pseudomonas aeruginosa]ETU73455.1 hypothetical protein Q094_06781 [Pseudomonas aeruginosa PS42]MDX4004399.1 hypothetical protein [Pseudomonas aeruginosa]OPE37233.1 hypothetical protein APB52_32745 [Pseudomonas aeruginosa]
MKANGLLKWLVPAVLLGIVLIIGKSWVAAPDAEPAHDPENRILAHKLLQHACPSPAPDSQTTRAASGF